MPVPPRYGYAVLSLAAIPPGLVSLRLIGSDSQRLPGVQGAAVPAAGTDSVRHPGAVLRHTPPPGFRAARHRLCRYARINIVALYLDTDVIASERITSIPRSSARAALAIGPFRPGPGRPSSHPHCRSLSESGSPRSPSPCAAKARQPPRTRPPPRPRSASLRVLGHWETCRRLTHPDQRKRRRHLPPGPLRLQDSQQPRPTRDPRPDAGATSTGITRPKAGKRV